MEDFFPGQRWTSEGEPELGVGIVTETSKGRVAIIFPNSGENRQYAIESAPLRRVIFKNGDAIEDTEGRKMIVEDVDFSGDLHAYFGQGWELSEAALGEVSDKHGVDDKLLSGNVDTPEVFSLRRNTLQHNFERKISPVNGFVGGRIDLIPHQLYIAHEVSSRYAPRVLLSDQVGLGKTIEACLILHRLLLSGRISRVLILVPDSLVHQWFVEMLRRFNLWFNIFDEERCEAIEEGAPEGNPFLDDQLVLCSTDFLAKSEKRARQALSASWDMLVVDEVHHLEWSPEQISPEYAIVEMLSKMAKGLLLLTATPEQLGVESHFARLRLLDPERYSDLETFKNEPHDHSAIANVVEALSADKPLAAPEKKLLESIFGQARLAAFEAGKTGATLQLIEDLLDQHGPGRVVFRNTRAAMTGFPTRAANLISLKAKENLETWQKRFTKEFVNDLETNSDQTINFHFAEDPRMDWLLDFLAKNSAEKVLLICRSKNKVLSLERAIAKRIKMKVAVFHEELTIVQRDRNAAWFAEKDGARLLLCSEIGSEGRNFQFAHHLVLLDLPFHPELLEQRIGRLDRIGQTENIQIHVPFVSGTPQEGLVRWFHEGLNAFEKNVEGGNKLSQLYSERLRAAILPEKGPIDQKQLDALIRETAAYQKELKQTLANGRDRLLEMNSFRPEIAQKLVEQIAEIDQKPALEIYMNRVLDHFSVETEDLAPSTYLLYPARAHAEAFPSIPATGISVTFDRKRALSREDISFLSWDHPIVTGALDMVLSSGTGATSFGILRGGGSAGLLLEMIFILEPSGQKNIDVDRFLPQTPLRVVVNHAGQEVTDKYPSEMLNQQLLPANVDSLIENDSFTDILFPRMIDAGTVLAEQLGKIEISKGLENMQSQLSHEINRLTALQRVNKEIRPDEIEATESAQTALAAAIEGSNIRLDALLLIQKGSF